MSLATPPKVRRLQRKLYIKAKEEPRFRFYQLYDKVYRKDLLAHAYALCRAAKGAAGVDGQSFADIESEGREEWLAVLGKELQAKEYRPGALRRVEIPKAGGGHRTLSIPTVRDRTVQQAAKLVLEPIYEADFEDTLYGYRPKRSAREAVVLAHQAICEGYTDVVDADLSAYFDTIPHDDLMRSVARRVCDRNMLKLVKRWLKAPVDRPDSDGSGGSGGRERKQGTPQGGVISPLLANIYMNRFARAWRERKRGEAYNAKLLIYADDFVILSRGKAKEAAGWARWTMERLGLTLNETKTSLKDARRETFDFLGYTLGPEYYRKDGHRYLAAKPSRKAIARLKDALRRVLRPSEVGAWPEVARKLNRRLVGWANYFGYGTKLMAYRAIDNFVTRRVQGFLQRRHKVQTRGTQRWKADTIFGELGVVRLRTLHLGARRGP